VTPGTEPRYFSSGIKGYARTIDKALTQCYNKKKFNFTDINDSIRVLQDLIRGAMIYTDKDQLIGDVNKLKASTDTNFFVYRIENRLKTTQSSIMMNLSLKNVSVELQFLFYANPKNIPLPGSEE
jgi:hypothetical protein